MERSRTPPAQSGPSTSSAHSPPTPQVARRIEENRLRAKAIRQRLEKEDTASPPGPLNRKRAYDAVSNSIPATSRDGRENGVSESTEKQLSADDRDKGAIRPANKKFAKYVDYNLTNMTDTKGGFLSVEDDPYNPVLHSAGRPQDKNGQDGIEQMPPHMTREEWERHQVLKTLRRQKAGPFEPGISVLKDKQEQKRCRECSSLEIDHVWAEVFKLYVCAACKERLSEKYSLLTKTECKEDYLLTDGELRDEELLPHLSKSNPHKSHWHDMMLFLRCQVEEYAFSDKKWGSPEKLDEEFERRQRAKKERKEKKFREKLTELKKKTRTDTFRREKGMDVDGDGTRYRPKKFGDKLAGGRHVHEWGNLAERGDGVTVRACAGCGMEVEEMVF